MTGAPSLPAPRTADATNTSIGPRRRDASATRRDLLDAAQGRFARDGYAATTVRNIAHDAGVNVALISRYFTSKEGLFEACLKGAVDELGRTVIADLSIDQVPRTIARQLTGHATGRTPTRLLLLLRTSGDERADQIRLDVLRSFAEGLASAADRPSGARDRSRGDSPILRAQIALAASFGIALLRSSTALEPLASATEQDLVGPLEDVIKALLPPSRAGHPSTSTAT